MLGERGNGPLVMRRPDSRWSGAVERPSAFRAGHIPSCYGSYERCALSLVAAVCRWSLLLLSPLLSAACDARHLGALVLVITSGPSLGDVTASCPAQTLPPNPIAPEPGDGRVRSRPSSRVHELCTFTEAVALRSQTVLTGSGSHRSCYGGFGEGYPHFHAHACLHPRVASPISLEGCDWILRYLRSRRSPSLRAARLPERRGMKPA